jgi:hypothetical protein
MDRLRSGVAGLLLCLSPFAASAAAPDGSWDWVVAPYAWAASIGTDMRTNTPPTDASTDTAFPDVVDILDGVFEVRGEGQGDAFGAFADFTYFGLADDSQRRFQRTESDLDMRLIEVAGVWSPGPARFTGFEAFAGARVIDLDFTLNFLPDNPAFAPRSIRKGETFYDFMAGARYTWAFSDRWSLTLRGDGSCGDTEGTWNASVLGQYHTHHGSWALGYRYLDVDLEDAGDTLSVTLDGPVIGYAFRF